MQAAAQEETIGCIGKCTLGLSGKELDQITDNINKTLTHPRGRQIFRKYLENRKLRDKLDCLYLYEMCCECIDIDRTYVRCSKNPTLVALTSDVERIKEFVEDLDGVPELDKALLESFNEALNSDSRNAMLGVLDDTIDSVSEHLKHVHANFKRYALEPCPMQK